MGQDHIYNMGWMDGWMDGLMRDDDNGMDGMAANGWKCDGWMADGSILYHLCYVGRPF